MFYYKNHVAIDKSLRSKYEYVRYISSEHSTFIPLFALNNNVQLSNGEFFSWLQLGTDVHTIKSKNINLLINLMPLSSSVQKFHIQGLVNSNVSTTERVYHEYVIHEHAMIYFSHHQRDVIAMTEPFILFTLVTKNHKQTSDRDFILLVRKDVKNKKNYELFVSKLIKWYSSKVEVLYVDNVEQYIYVDPQVMYKGLHSTVNISTLKELLFEQPQTERTHCRTGICQ